MNILFLCDEYPPCQHGGIGTVTQNLARELVSKGHHVFVCGFYPYFRFALSTEDDQGVKIYRLFYGNSLLLKLSRNKYLGWICNIKSSFNSYTKYLKELIKTNRINIIEIPDFNEAFRYSGPKLICFPDFGIPAVIKLHGSYSFLDTIYIGSNLRNSIFRKEKYLIQHAEVVIAISEFTAKGVKTIFNYHKNIPVIYNGIPLNKVFSYNENSGNNLVVFVGKLTEEKGILSLVKAWGEVIIEVPSAKLILYGRAGKEIIEQIYSLLSDDARRTVELKGFVKKYLLSEIFRSASCAVFPSYAENFGMAPLESMLEGCPTVFTKRTSGPELIADGTEGLLVDPDNIDELSDAIIFLLKNRDKAVEIGRRGALKVRSHFDISKIADQHIDLYNKIIKKVNDPLK